jgi:hypothetical protein
VASKRLTHAENARGKREEVSSRQRKTMTKSEGGNRKRQHPREEEATDKRQEARG